jgi:hypothetical protein
MNRLKKLIEQDPRGDRPGRVAYVLDRKTLPAPTEGFEWRTVDEFRPGDAILDDPGLKAVFERALREGCAIVAFRER